MLVQRDSWTSCLQSYLKAKFCAWNKKLAMQKICFTKHFRVAFVKAETMNISLVTV